MCVQLKSHINIYQSNGDTCIIHTFAYLVSASVNLENEPYSLDTQDAWISGIYMQQQQHRQHR